jgi:hypothetical protein
MAMPMIAARSSNCTFFMCCYLLGTAQLAGMTVQPASAKSRRQCFIVLKLLNKNIAAKGRPSFNNLQTINRRAMQSVSVASLLCHKILPKRLITSS